MDEMDLEKIKLKKDLCFKIEDFSINKTNVEIIIDKGDFNPLLFAGMTECVLANKNFISYNYLEKKPFKIIHMDLDSRKIVIDTGYRLSLYNAPWYEYVSFDLDFINNKGEV